MTTNSPTVFPPQVAAALEHIRAECLREEWVPADELPDQAATYQYVTDSVYLPGADWKPGAGEFEDYGDASAHAYLVVLAYELVTAKRLARPGDPDAGVLRRSVAVDVDRRMLARTGGRYCPRTADLHRPAGTVLAAACLDCEIHGA